MTRMFNGCTKLTSIDVNGFNLEKVRIVDCIFGSCISLKNIDVSSWNTSNISDMGYLFSGCTGLTNMDLSNFNTSNTTRFRKMFSGCTNLKTLRLSNNFKIADNSNVSDMFENTSINIKIISIQDTADKIIANNSNLTINNFEIIN